MYILEGGVLLLHPQKSLVHGTSADWVEAGTVSNPA